MRIARIESGGAPVTAVVDGDAVRPLPGVEVLELLGATPDARTALASRAAGELALADVRLLAPIQPGVIRDFSVFEQHSEGAVMAMGGPDAQVQAAWYERPAFYFSSPNVVTGPDAPIAAPPGCELLDLELEVAAIVGRRGSNLTADEAGAYIAGYTIFNDWSARDIAAQELRLPFGFHKTKDFANTLGPWIVTADELEPYRDGDRLDLGMRAYVNDVALGHDTLANMAWSFEELVAFSARGSVIAPGDVVASGTCGGGCLFELWGRNGSFSDPAPLAPGDEVRLEVEGIGALVNRVVAQEWQPDDPPRATPGRRRHRAGTGA